MYYLYIILLISKYHPINKTSHYNNLDKHTCLLQMYFHIKINLYY